MLWAVQWEESRKETSEKALITERNDESWNVGRHSMYGEEMSNQLNTNFRNKIIYYCEDLQQKER